MLVNPLSYYDPDNPYPESDGQPMAENTEQYEWLVKIKENLEILFADREDVFVAGDLLRGGGRSADRDQLRHRRHQRVRRCP